MAIEFPLSPSIDDQFTADGKTWYWDGEKWIFASTNPETISAVSPITYETVTQTIGIEEDRLISFVTSETRPESPVDGQIIFETDTALYFGWNGSEWTSIGENLSSITPENLGTAAVGVATDAARGDHVHNMPSASDVGADPVGSASAAQSAAESYADGLAPNYDPAGSASSVAGDLTTHEGLTTSVHGISDTEDLVYTSDSRLSDARTPTVHASSHESGGSDELELAPSQVTGTAIVSDDVHLISFVTSSTRPESPSEGQVIYETDTDTYFGWKGSSWLPIGGGATGGGTDDVFYENSKTVTTDYTITTNKNAMSAGPIEIASGVNVEIPSGSVWVIL
jgi:hypothetical protein